MQLRFDEIGEVLRVSLQGRLDSAGVDVIETQFQAGVVAKGKNTVVDLTEVTFLASLGIRMIIAATRSLSFKGAKIALFGAIPAVMDIIDAVALDDIVPIAATQADAIALVTG